MYTCLLRATYSKEIIGATPPCLNAAAFNSYDYQYERKCLLDTRVELLRLVTEWVDDL